MVVQYGETIVLVTVVSTQEERPSDFLPLTVEYQEKIYAAGRIPGNYFRREIGRPSEKELSIEEKYERLKAQNKLLKAENELLKKIDILERGTRRKK